MRITVSRSALLSFFGICSLALAVYLSATVFLSMSTRTGLIISGAAISAYIFVTVPIMFFAAYFAALIVIPGFAHLRLHPVFVTEVVLAGLFTRAVVTGSIRKSIRVYSLHPRLLLPLVLLLILASVSLVRGYENGMTAMRDSVIVFYCILALLVPSVIDSPRDLYRFCLLMIAAGLLMDCRLAIQLFTVGFGQSEMATPRLFGARTSAFLFFVGALAASGVFGRTAKAKRYLKYFGVTQFLLIISLSGTRNVWISAAASFLFWTFFVKRTPLSAKSILRYTFLLMVFALAIVSLSPPQEETGTLRSSYTQALTSIVEHETSANASSRLAWWREAFSTTATQNPILGKPFGSMTLFMKYSPRYDEEIRMAFHNSYVTVLYFMGFPGLAFLLLFVVRTLRLGVRKSRTGDSPDVQKVSSALVTSFFFYCAVAFFNVILEGPQSAMFFWLIAGLIMVLNEDLLTAEETDQPAGQQASNRSFGIKEAAISGSSGSA